MVIYKNKRLLDPNKVREYILNAKEFWVSFNKNPSKYKVKKPRKSSKTYKWDFHSFYYKGAKIYREKHLKKSFSSNELKDYGKFFSSDEFLNWGIILSKTYDFFFLWEFGFLIMR